MLCFQDIEIGEVMLDCLVSSVKASLEGVSKKVRVHFHLHQMNLKRFV
jgi:hypothetical protein